jgi:PKD repeat protein
VDGLGVTFDPAASSDPDGTIVGHAWDFGDSTTSSDPAPQHTYAVAGTYVVTLTVTDDDGAVGTATQSVTVADDGGPIGFVAADTFGRTLANSWGNADVGGTWSTTGSTANYSVADGQGRQRMTGPGARTETSLTGFSTRDVLASVDIGFDAALTGGGVYTYLGVRRNGTTDYQARVRFQTNGASITLYRVQNGSYTQLAAVGVPLTYNVGDIVRVQFEAIGANPTTLRSKMWKVGQTEPANWQVTTTDSTAALQTGGGIGIANFLSGTSTGALVATLDDVFVTEVGG